MPQKIAIQDICYNLCTYNTQTNKTLCAAPLHFRIHDEVNDQAILGSHDEHYHKGGQASLNARKNYQSLVYAEHEVKILPDVTLIFICHELLVWEANLTF